MKNIHLIPTDKTSRLLYFGTSNELILQINPATFRAFERNLQHIYITSDEEIKEGDYYISILENEVYKATKETQNIMSVANLIGTTSYKKTHFKIILTTDQDLIKDGVQSIDDTFSEWFVENPSCEFVKIIDDVECLPMPNIHINKHIYKIIIPQEEQKQHLIDMMRGDEELGLYNNNTAIGMHTLTDTTTGCNSSRFGKKEIVKDLAYWKANAEEDYMKVPISILRYISELENQMYTEEDLRQAYNYGMFAVTSGRNFKDWFTNYKSK